MFSKFGSLTITIFDKCRKSYKNHKSRFFMRGRFLNIFLPLHCIVTLLLVFGQTAKTQDGDFRPKGANEVDSLIKIAEKHRALNVDSMPFFIKPALKKSKDIGYIYGECRSLMELGLYYYFTGDYTNAIKKLNKSEQLAISLNRDELLAGSYTFLNLSYTELRQYEISLYYNQKFNDIAIKAGNSNWIMESLTNFAVTYIKLRDYDKALLKAEESFKLSLEEDLFVENIGWSANGLAYAYFAVGNYDKALEYCQIAFKHWDSINFVRGKVNTTLIANEILSVTDPNTAITELDQMLPSLSTLASPSLIARAYLLKSISYKNLGNKKLMEEWAKKGLSLCIENQILDEGIRISNLLVEYYARNNNIKKELEIQRKKSYLKDIVGTLRRVGQNTWIEQGQWIVDKTIENNRLKAEESQYRITLLKQKFYTIFFSILAVILLIVSIWGYRLLKRQEKSNKKLVLLNKDISEKMRTIQFQQHELTKTNAKLEKANQSLSSFAYVAAHDLKSPLGTIKTLNEILNDKYLPLVKAEDKDIFLMIQNSCLYLIRLVDDILEFSKIAGTKKKMGVVSLENVLFIVIHNLSSSITTSNATINYKNLPKILGDFTLISVLFQNILSNSLKFSRPHTSPEINISHKDLGNGWIQISITDNGIGIANEYLDDIFNLFTKVHRSSEYPGSGIGLSSCAKIIESMDGKIWVESKLNHYTTFHIKIKAAANDSNQILIKNQTHGTVE